MQHGRNLKKKLSSEDQKHRNSLSDSCKCKADEQYATEGFKLKRSTGRKYMTDLHDNITV
jgi:hypothetical protein